MKRHWIYDIPIIAEFEINGEEVTKEEYLKASEKQLNEYQSNLKKGA